MSEDLPRTLKFATVWLVVGAIVFVAYQWRRHEALKATFTTAGGIVEIRQSDDGHYHWPGTLNGERVDFLVDTGASGVAIPAALAERLRLSGEETVRSSTAGGWVTGRVVRADLALDGGVRAERLRMVALPNLDAPLLGMEVLGRLHWQQGDRSLRIDLGAGSAGGPAS
ncbi:MAG TPA: retropepsin-like aspartic protease [Caldimonas sp.]|jgi:aspartyl protease family protein|nr:retropepsin-like aspartic protease [Caldimonas sp.]